MKRSLFYLILIFPFLTACQGNWKKSDPTNEKDKVTISRYDRLLDDYVTTDNVTALQEMDRKYPKETKLLVEDVLTLGNVDEPNINARLRTFYLDTTVQTLMKSVREKFADMSSEERLFSKAFHRLHHEVPQAPVPRIYTQVSALNQSIIIGDGILGISLDKYLGSDFPLYRSFYYDYQIRTMSRDRIVPDAMSSYLMEQYPMVGNWKDHSVMEQILHIGKINWAIYKLLDMKSMDEAIGFSKDRAQWCSSHRDAIGRYLSMLDVWHATDSLTFSAVMLPHSNTPALGEGSSDAVGAWLGIHICNSYMQCHPKVTLGQFLADNDYKKIFAKSGYFN